VFPYILILIWSLSLTILHLCKLKEKVKLNILTTT